MVRKETAVSMPGLTRLVTNNSFAIQLWNSRTSFYEISGKSSITSKILAAYILAECTVIMRSIWRVSYVQLRNVQGVISIICHTRIAQN